MKNWIYFIVIAIALGAFYPFVHNYIFFGSLKTIMSLVFVILWYIILSLQGKRFVLPNKIFNRIVFVQALFLFLYAIYFSVSFITLFYLVLSWIILCLVINTFSITFFLTKLIKLNILFSISSTIGFFLVSIGLLNVLGVYEYQGGEYKIFNFGFFFMKHKDVITDIRPSSYYDEPGSFAFVVMFLLLINRKYFKNMRWEYALLLLPLITTSLAHFFTIIVFVLLFYLNKKNRVKFFALSLCFFLLATAVNYGALGEDTGKYFKRKSIDRIESLIAGEDLSRQGGLDLGPLIFKEYSWGYPKELVSANYPGFVNETIWGPIIYYGILGIPFYFLPFILIFVKSLRTKNHIDLAALVLVLINFIQRPYYMYPLFIVLIYFLFFIEKKDLLQD